MHPILTRFLAGLIQDYIESEKKIAFERGETKAKQTCYQQETVLKTEYANNFDNLRAYCSDVENKLSIANNRLQENIWELHDNRETPAIQFDSTIYGPDRFEVTIDKAQRMRSEVADAVAKKLVSPPSEDQWNMILSDHPSVCVVAGAGSGKSTTLVLRVVFMICHLGIRPRDITVVSFTRASCKELREKLLKLLSFEHWKQQLNPEDAAALDTISKDLVKTYHSALGRMARSQFPRVQWFDMLGGKEANITLDNDDIENPLTSSRLTEPQLELLLEAFRQTFTADSIFRKHVIELIEIEFARDMIEESPETIRVGNILKFASQRDLEIVTLINAKWHNEGWEIPGIDPTPFVAFKANGHPFYANGRIIGTDMPVFLSLNGFINEKPIFSSEELVGARSGGQSFPLHGALKVRRDIVAQYFGGKKLDIRTTSRLESLALRVQYLEKTEFNYTEAPRVDIELSGELGKIDLIEAFYAQASFIESLGMEVPATLAKLAPFKSHTPEYHFTAALVRFWPVFEKTLVNQASPIMTFNRAFLLLGEGHAQHTINVPSDILSSFTHLLVDEFQDISPQIVSWIRATQRRLLTLGKKPTLMAIGDDWQSIYSWRGSAPELFIEFGKHFPSSASLGGHGECRMMANYRSVAPVLIDAEKVLRPVSIKIKKEANATRKTEDTDHGVLVKVGVDPGIEPLVVVEEIKRQLEFVNSLTGADKNKVVVLSRTQKVRDAIEKSLGKIPGVSFYTFHGSKGLQGEVAILCENCDYDGQHLFRNAVYKASGLFSQTYDDAAKDEALRLAYVAITRGIRRVIWFMKEPVGAAKFLAS